MTLDNFDLEKKKDRQVRPDSLYEHGVKWNEWALLKIIALFRFKTQNIPEVHLIDSDDYR